METYDLLSGKPLPTRHEGISFRVNNWENAHVFRDTIMGLIRSDNVSFEKLMA